MPAACAVLGRRHGPAVVTPGRHGLEAPSCQHAHHLGRSGSGCPFPTPAQWQLLLLHFHSSSFRHPTKQGSAQRSPSPSGPLVLRPAPPPSQLANCLEGAEALQRWPLRFALLKCSRARNDRVIHRQEQRGQQCSTEGQHHFGSSTASTPSSRSPWPSSWQSTPREGGTDFSMHSTAAPHSAPSETRSFSQRTGTGDTPLLAAAWAGSNAQPREV